MSSAQEELTGDLLAEPAVAHSNCNERIECDRLSGQDPITRVRRRLAPPPNVFCAGRQKQTGYKASDPEYL